MGVCNISTDLSPDQNNKAYYPEEVKLRIRTRQKDGHMRIETVTTKLTKPSTTFGLWTKVRESRLYVSGWVLPGLDPKFPNSKEWQDNAFIMEKDSVLFAVLMDGHGEYGARFVQNAETTLKEYYNSHQRSFVENPIEEFEKCLKHVDVVVKKKMDWYLTGSTAIILFIDATNVYYASLGDSRAVLATQTSNSLSAIQLTVDQKPQDPAENERIKQAGGFVARLTDHYSKERVGPYRVWKNDKEPGLAMSRSLGDTCGHDVGIICTPVSETLRRQKGNDMFIVIASDGVWDVMSNEDVVTFVEEKRHKSRKQTAGLGLSQSANSITQAQCTITEALAEEARHRWFEIVENEDALIDDISWIVIELSTTQSSAGLEVTSVCSEVTHDSPAPPDEILVTPGAGRNANPMRMSVARKKTGAEAETPEESK